MATNTTKTKYTTPSVKVVDWDFNEDICVQPVCNSFSNCLKVESKSAVHYTEIRDGETGSWEWIRNGSR